MKENVLVADRVVGERSGESAAAAVPFSSNEIRLSPRQCVVAIGLLLLLLYGLPRLWELVEPFKLKADYRLPFKLGNDYWFFNRYCRTAASEDRVLVLGDSVVWGHYVRPDQTLSHYLAEQAGGRSEFVNLGVDGIHPAAMLGLVRYYARPIRNRRVLLHCNFLWLSSKRHDLQAEKEFTFNHPRLVPQFRPWIPCYRASLSERLGNVLERYVPLLAWSRHIRLVCFNGRTVGRWTLEHPYASPFAAVMAELPSPAEPPSPEPVAKPWTQKGMQRYDADWVPLEQSFQWRCFRSTVKLLRQRGNRVLVVIGPFNEHMLTQSSRVRYQNLKKDAIKWLTQEGIPCIAPEPLPSDEYADASHPLAAGYKRLAAVISHEAAFRSFLGF